MKRESPHGKARTARLHSKPSHPGIQPATPAQPVRGGKRSPGKGGNRVRIVAGRFRGRWIEFPDLEGLRPTGNRVRETLFNWLGQRMDGQRCLDAFAGSGALGFEAASRGAANVVLLDTSGIACAALERNRARLDARMCQVERCDALTYLGQAGATFDVILVDPPFASGLLPEVLVRAQPRLAPGGRLYCEWREPVEEVLARMSQPAWEVVRTGKAGVVHFALLVPRDRPR
ncbi:MAG: 16S rRNA (guanine(966)-N(2))-methyltransferase RsmD [Betaproteobacteria bacterium]|nr:16S rRNA (guanine(966)-N(2))-methyltransferase RsmD [Betaproteobacteria bacterium]